MSKNREIKDSIDIIESYLDGTIEQEISASELAKHLKNIKNSDILILGPGSIFGDQLKYLTQNIYILFLILFCTDFSTSET